MLNFIKMLIVVAKEFKNMSHINKMFVIITIINLSVANI